MTRYIVIWSPGFEAGESRHAAVNTLKAVWAIKAPQLVSRRIMELKETMNAEILESCLAWLKKHYHRDLLSKKLSIVAISDPAWEDDEARWTTSFKAMRLGYKYEAARTRPSHVVLSVQVDTL